MIGNNRSNGGNLDINIIKGTLVFKNSENICRSALDIDLGRFQCLNIIY